MIGLIRKITPKIIFDWYHRLLAQVAALYYGYPAKGMIVIGVTGTNGKTTTVNLIAHILEAAGYVVGLTSTVNFKIAERTWLNDLKMTMPGRFKLQKFLSELGQVGGKYAVIETSSQGIVQHRHRGINYDVAVFTNLTPEHLEAHGGFENYKKAKGDFFAWVANSKRKIINGQLIHKVSVVNMDDAQADYFLNFDTDKKITYSLKNVAEVRAKDLEIKVDGARWTVNGVDFETNLLGEFNVENCLAAMAVGLSQQIPLEVMARALKNFSVPGRLESIEAGQNFKVIVDYAPEPVSLGKLYELIKSWPKAKIIHVLGSTGGGRDVARRSVLGRLAGEKSDVVIVTNEDPYDDEPMEIINQVAAGAMVAGKVENQDLFLILDRAEAIDKAMSLAGVNDLVLITGKGAEQAIMSKNGKMIPWDDREVAKQALLKIL